MGRTKCTLSAALLTAGAVVGTALPNAPVSAATSTVSQDPSPSFQTNGRVDAILRVGTTVYVGGSFTTVRPAGSPAGSGDVARARLAAFSAVTGDLLPWNPGANSTVNALAASPGGHTIYVGGKFGRLGGKPRRNLGAVGAASGAATKFRADTDRRVLALAATKSRVYVGGKLTRIDGKRRARLAALTAHGRLLRDWRPKPNHFVRAIALSRRSVLIGGDFTRVGRKKQAHLAKLSVKRGRLQTFHGHPKYPVVEITLTAHRVFLAGNGAGGHAASYTRSGGLRWVRQFDGAVHGVAFMNGALYVGGQFAHLCVGNTPHPGHGFDCPKVQAARRNIAALSSASGSPLAWNPGVNSVDGVFAVTSAGGSVHIGGDFTNVHGVSQQGYAAFE